MPTIDLAFELVGATIPLDHGYCLFAALSGLVPALHGDRRIGVHPIRGRQTVPRVLSLDREVSRLRLRLPSEEVASYLAIAGAALDLNGHRLRVGIPRVEALTPAATLAARLVTFRHTGARGDNLFRAREDNARAWDACAAAAGRELDRLGIAATLEPVPSTRPTCAGEPLRRALKIKDKRVIGFALQVAGLTAEESIRLQEQGLGGRRRFGCGVFVPFTEAGRRTGEQA